MKSTVVLLVSVLALAAVGSVAVGSVAAATDANGSSMSPDDPPTANNSSVSPGQQLAGAVGAQGATVEGELWNRTLSDRLEDATTSAERAQVLADEIETIETYVEALEGVRENVTTEFERGEMSESEYRASLSGFVVRSRTVELRANRTVRAAENLSLGMRSAYNVNVTRARQLENRSYELYQFEGEIAQEVANETLENESAESEMAWLNGEQNGR